MTPYYELSLIEAIAAKHGLSGPCAPMPRLGIVNDIWSIGTDYVLRIPIESEYASSMMSESVALPRALRAGVRTPRLIVFDDARDIVPLPYSVTERVPGWSIGESAKLSTFDAYVLHFADVIESLARELVALHHSVEPADEPRDHLNPWWLDDPSEKISDGVEAGWLSLSNAKWLEAVVTKTSSAFAYDPSGPCDQSVFVHHDLHPWNVMVTEGSPGDLALTAILDWGNATLGDPAVDFCGFPLWALPPLVDCYRLQGGVTDSTFEGRVLWMWLALALSEPQFLDSKVFKRQWWRLPEDGVSEMQYRLLLMPESWRQWTL